MSVWAAPVSRREVRRGERRAAIVALAEAMFDEHGYGGTTMSAVAAALGGSKSTLWAYFACKEELFAAVIDGLVADFATAINLDPEAPLAPTLRRYATEFLTMMLSPQVVALNRLVIAEASRFPELGRIFYERGPQRRHRALADYFDGQIRRGTLRTIDPATASARFHHLCQSGLFIRTLWGLQGEATADAVRDDAAACAALFLEGYGACGA